MSHAVSFLLGAGFSAPFNVPTMRPFLTSFQNFATQKYPHLAQTIQTHLGNLETDSDIEGLLSNLDKAEQLPSAMPSHHQMADELRHWASDSKNIKAHLVSYIIERCEQFDRARSEQELRPFLIQLNESTTLSEVNFFTTNYDRIIEYVTERTQIALDDGFGPDELVAPWTGLFKTKCRLYKLHGSVTYYIDQQSTATNDFLRLDRGYPLPDPDFRLSRHGRELEPLMVLPTHEKDTMHDPYSHLTHVFTETLSNGGLLVTIGSSLRDSHLVGAMNYYSKKLVVLVVDANPAVAIARIPNLRSIPLKTTLAEFFNVSTESLVKLVEQCATFSDIEEIAEAVCGFVAKQNEILAARGAMTDIQRDLVDLLRDTASDIEKIEAMQQLHSLPDAGVIDAVSGLMDENQTADVRKAAAGCLGLSRNSSAVEVLAKAATHDHSPDVRLETYLALREIGGADANRALEHAQRMWPDDPFFWNPA